MRGQVGSLLGITHLYFLLMFTIAIYEYTNDFLLVSIPGSFFAKLTRPFLKLKNILSKLRGFSSKIEDVFVFAKAKDFIYKTSGFGKSTKKAGLPEKRTSKKLFETNN